VLVVRINQALAGLNLLLRNLTIETSSMIGG